MKRFIIVMMGLICAASRNRLVLAQKAPECVPELRIYKVGVALGEDIEFYLQLKGVTRARIEALRKAGVAGQVEITTPDGKMTTYQVDLRDAGMGTTYVLGSNRIRKERVVAGRYTLAFVYAMRRSPLVTVTVTDLPVLKQVEVTLHLEGAPGFPQCLSMTHTTLTVKNNTEQTVRFPRLSEMEGMDFSVRVQSGSWAEKGRTFDIGFGGPNWAYWFTWDVAEIMPTVVLKPGAKYEQQISLKPALDDYLEACKHDQPIPPGRYEVTLRQTLAILVGERHDALAGFFPVHREVTVSTVFTSHPRTR